MNGSFKFDPRRFQRAARRLAEVPRAKPVQDVMKGAAGQVVRKVVGVTPPARGKADAGARKAGEATIAADLAKILIGASKRVKKLQDAAEVHARNRDRGTGRVNPRNRKVKAAVAKQDLANLRKVLRAQVGELAAGWNAAARGLGVKLPAWIARHGESNGVFRIVVRGTGIRITIGNAVEFVDNIRELDRRLQWALDSVARSIVEKQIPAAVRKIGSQAGFRAK